MKMDHKKIDQALRDLELRVMEISQLVRKSGENPVCADVADVAYELEWISGRVCRCNQRLTEIFRGIAVGEL